MKYWVGGPYPPVIWDGRAGSGSEWVAVEPGTTLADVEWLHTESQVMHVERIELFVRSGTKVNEYHKVIVEDRKVVHCDCYGWLYRRHCRHADQVTEALRRQQ